MKRPVDDDQQGTPEGTKRIKIEDETLPENLQIVENVVEDEREDWKPTQVILSTEAYSVSYFRMDPFFGLYERRYTIAARG